MTSPVPSGFGIVLDAATKQLDRTTLFGGSPARVVRLSARGLTAWDELRAGRVRSITGGTLARQLTDAGLAHPCPPEPGQLDVTVIIPVRDRPAMLARCLTALGTDHPVLVVDDGSDDPDAVADIAARHGATVVRRPHNGGPGAARNTGLSQVHTDVVAFIDSDCVAPAGWIEQLSAHLADPLVAAVAPRIVPAAGTPRARGYRPGRSTLDLGDSPARVMPTTRVAYVPTAALVVRRAALPTGADATDVFDPALRYGEDVDLIWRLHDEGWRIRYDPSVQVQHHEPPDWRGVLGRRFHYGTSAAPLARRHPTAMAPLVLHPWPALTVATVLSGRPLPAAASLTAAVLTMTRTLRRAGVPTDGVLRPMLVAVRQTWLGVGRYGTQFAAPLIGAALIGPGRSTRGWGRRAAAASLLLGPPLTAWAAERPRVDPLRFTAGHLAEDIAYGSGVWAGCLRERCFTPIRPVVSWRPLHVSRVPTAPFTLKEPS